MRIICYLLIYLWISLSYSQNRSFHHFRVEDGLSHNSVISMLQDHRGFMWFGTKDGLNRFDGYNYKVFQHKSGDSTSIGSNFIRCLHEYKNKIWVGTDTGLFKYDEKTESFTLIPSTKDQPILDIAHDNLGNVWFIASGNLHKIIAATSTEEVYKQANFSFISKSNSGTIYVSSINEIFRYVKENNSLQKLDLGKKVDNPLVITAIDATIDTNTIYIGTKNKGALTYSIITEKITPLFTDKSKPTFIRDILRKSNSELWIASESGIYIYNLKSKTFQNFKKNYNNPYSISDNAIYCLVKDQEGGVWIGTYFGGVNYYPKQYSPITRYFPRVGENSISGNAVREIKKDTFDNIWIGTEDAGLNKLDTQTGLFKNYTPTQDGGILSHYNIHGLLPRGPELWIGTFEHGLDVMDIKSGKIIKHYGTGSNEGDLHSDFILYLYETKNKDLYTLTSLGVYKYVETSDNFEIVEGFPDIYHYTFLLEDHKGILWAGTYWDGLYYYNPRTGEKGFYKYNSTDSKSISSNVINGIFEDSKKRLWITTENGLNLFNRKTQNFKRITKDEGLPGNVTYAILEDIHNNLWISTSNGLVSYNPNNENLTIYTKSNGLLSDQFNYSSFFKDDSGEMYFGSVNGLISFNPDTFKKNMYQPPIYITDIQINNEVVEVNGLNSPLKKSISFSSELELNSKQSSFNLTFASLSYTSPEMTKYWYKLEGLNDKWISLGKNHEVSFTGLPPGNYIFKVKALNSDGVSTKNIDLKLKILPPFFASRAAYIFYSICFLFGLFIILRYYHIYNKDKNNQRIQQLENAKEKEIYQAKIDFFTNIAHEIRTPLTLIKSPLEKLLKSTYKSPEIPKNLGIMEKNTSRLLNLVNELLDFRKTEMQHVKLNFVEININEMLEETHLRFSQMIQEKQLQFDLLETEKTTLAFVDEEAIKKILSNLFSNAIKYSKKIVSIELKLEESNFLIIIKNDGNLIPRELQQRIFEPFYRVPGESQNIGTGIGLSLAYSLAELHHGKLYFESEYEMNTFILRMPVYQPEGLKNIYKHSDSSSTRSDIKSAPQFSKNAPFVLVAEDNRELADFIDSELSATYNVIVASNGKEALGYFSTYDIQLVISDVMMPELNGIELCKQIKENVKTSHIPVILLTAKSALNAKIEGLESGADAYISKPFSMDHVVVQISNLLENRKTILGHYSNSPLAHLKSLSLSQSDQDFLSKLDNIIEKNLKDTNLNVESLASLMNMSRSTLYRKIKEISSLSPNELINLSRLKKAAFLLKTTNKKIFEIAEEVGYKSQTNFGRNFQKQFGMTPSEFLKKTD